MAAPTNDERCGSKVVAEVDAAHFIDRLSDAAIREECLRSS